ncbi:MAG TPA: efflux RND transporter periplasmic adaptor subunit [Vicinamibacterales bacterium]|jgi:cobalt-zinc-cadmium efflux system membrane fusion protein
MTRLIALLVLVSSFAVAGCGGTGQASMTSFSANERPESRAELFTLPENQAARVQIFTVATAPLARVLRLTGTVAYNGFLTTPVISQVGGPVSRILVTPGQQVKTGQPLLYVASPDFSLLRSGYIKAKDAFELAEKIDKRAQDLYQHGAIAQADVEQADSGKAQAYADLEAAEQGLRIVGITNPQDFITKPSTGEIALVSPTNGEVVERLCNQGQLLQAGATQCFTLSDMSHVWVLVNIYQNDIANVKVGDEVTITNETYPGSVRGKIQYIAPSLDPATRTLQARIEAANPGERLKKDMYVTANVQAGTIADAIAVPDSAVLRDAQNLPYVYIETGNRQFARRSVTIGDSQDGKTQVLSGLQGGDRIVGDGSLFLQFQNTLQQ